MRFSPEVLKLFVGLPYGQYTGKPQPRSPIDDQRTAALRSFRRFVNDVTFYRAGPKNGPPIDFKVPKDSFLIEWPDREVDLQFPACVVVPGNGAYEDLGIGGSFLIEKTRDVFGKGTVLQMQSQYIETFQLAVLGTSRAERRALRAGIESLLFPSETASGLKLKMPTFYNQIGTFLLSTSQVQDDEDSAKGRRVMTFGIELRFTSVVLVTYADLLPTRFPGLDDQIGPNVITSRG